MLTRNQENKMNIRIQTDLECNAEKFWEGVQFDFANETKYKEICKFLLSPKLDAGVVVTKKFADEVEEFCTITPGWHSPEYPDFASTPILFIETKERLSR